MARKVSLADLFELAARSVEYEENPSAGSLDSALKRMGYSRAEIGFIKNHYGAIHYAFSERVGALDILDGVRGTCKIVDPELVTDVRKALNDAFSLGTLGYIGLIEDLDVAKGTLIASRAGKSRTYRLGKILQKAGATSTLLHKFETRQVSLEWVITADPMEVASMSYGRAWTSCMRPGHEYEEGPIYDVLAGSALILFYRPGSDKPCGRIVLRPSAVLFETDEGDKIPEIIMACREYGTAALIPTASLEHAIAQQRGLEVKVSQRALSYRDGPYLGVYDDCLRAEVDVKMTDIPELTTALRKTWIDFVDLPERSAEGMEEPKEPDRDVHHAEALSVAYDFIAMWYENQMEYALEPPTWRTLSGLLQDQGFSELLSDNVAEEEIANSRHGLIVLTNEDFDPRGADIARFTKIKRFDTDFWYKNFTYLVRKYEDLARDQDDPVQVWGAEVQNKQQLDRLAQYLNDDPDVHYWEVVIIG